MATTLIFSLLNPVKFHPEDGADAVSNYLTKYFDRTAYEATLDPHQEPMGYLQPWQTSDTIRLQCISSYGPLTLSLIDSDGRVWLTSNFTQTAAGPYADTFIYEISISLTTIPEGIYSLKLVAGSPVQITLLSEPFCLKEIQPLSVLLEYANYEFKEDMIFETGFAPSKRVKGKIRYKSPASRDTLFEDQTSNQTLLDSKTYRVWELIVGDSYGVADYEIDTISRILGCSSVKIDGRAFTKADGAKWEEAAQEDYPLRGWTIGLRESVNRNSNIYETDGIVNQLNYVVAVDTKGWGFDSGSEQLINDIM